MNKVFYCNFASLTKQGTAQRCALSSFIVLVALSFTMFLSIGCKDGGKKFRNVLRSAANDVGKPKKRRASKKDGDASKRLARANPDAIKKCPENAIVFGAAPPSGKAQFCGIKTKEGQNVYHGPYRRWHGNEKLKWEGHYKDGQYHGSFREWYKSGKPKNASHYFEGSRHGKYMEWNKDGSVKLSGAYKDEVPHGFFVYYSSKGKVHKQGAYVNGMEHGPWKTYHSNGALKSEKNINQGMLHGLVKTYARDGALLSQAAYAADLQHGPWAKFWKDGNKREIGSYLQGQQDGKWVEYKRNGQISKTVIYEKGVIVRSLSPRRKSIAKRKRRKVRRAKFGRGDILGARPPLTIQSDRQEHEDPLKIEAPKQKKKSGWETL